MEIIRQGEQFTRIFELEDASFDSLRQIIIKCYSDINPKNEFVANQLGEGQELEEGETYGTIVFLKALRPDDYPGGINLTKSQTHENRIDCFFSRKFTKNMTLGLWKVEAFLEEEDGGYDAAIHKPMGYLFNVLPTTIK